MRTKSNILLLIGTGAALVAAPVFAQTAQTPAQPTPSVGMSAPDAELMRFLANSKEYDDSLNQKAHETFLQLNRGCQTVDKSKRLLPSVFSTVKFFSPEPYAFAPPTAGHWVEHFDMTGCTKNIRVNILSVAQGNAYPSFFATLPGTTVADPGSKRDAENIAQYAIRQNVQACLSTPTLLSGDLIGYLNEQKQLQPKNTGLGWFETWHFWHCEAMLDVQMAFTPSPNGGFQIRARVAPTAKPASAAPAATPAPSKTAAPSPAPTNTPQSAQAPALPKK